MLGIKVCKVMIFSENKKLLMQVGMENHNLGGKSEKMSWKKKLQFLKMLTLLLPVSTGLIFKSEKKTGKILTL